MKRKHYIICLILGVILGCNSPNQEKDKIEEPTIEKNIKDSLEEESQINDSTIETQNDEFDSTIFVDLLKKFYNQDDYYVPLYFIDNYSEPAAKELKNTKTEVIYQDDENRRTKLDEQIVEKHLLVNNLDQIIVINENQNIIDTLTRKNYEYYEATIESSYIATYESDSIGENNVIVSLNGLKNIEFRKSPEFKSDSTYIQNLILKNSFNPDDIYSFGHLNYELDTITFLSFGDYKQGKECLYLLKNGEPIDSVINDYVISTMTPVPLATDKELIYVSSVHIPETDIHWNSLTGIDLENYKFRFYERNRIKIKDANRVDGREP